MAYLRPVPHPLTGGLDRSVHPLRADPSTFYQLHNLRQTPRNKGQLEQTKSFRTYATFTRGTYFSTLSNTSVLESANDSVLRIFAPKNSSSAFFAVTTLMIHQFAGSTIQVFYQAQVPTNTTINGHCLAVINSVSGFNLTRGFTLDVEITSATEFKWRKNGGAYSASIAISTAGNSIDSGNVTLYWLTATGFTIGDAWSWRRTDSSLYNPNSGVISDQDFVNYKDRTYFVNRESRVMVLQPDDSGVYYAISVGYRPVYGNTIEIFYDHLYVGGYQTTALTSVVSNDGVVANSDLGDLDCFFPTDVNEADSFTIPTNTKRNSALSYIRSIVRIRDHLFVFTDVEIWFTPYLGLPNVNDFTKYRELPQTSTVFSTSDSVYIYTTPYDVYQFNGVDLTLISLPIKPVDTSLNFVDFLYNTTDLEEVFVNLTDQILYVRQAEGTWYTRSVAFTNRTTTCAAYVYGILLIGTTGLKVFTEDLDWSDTPEPITDATPKFVTQFVTGGFMNFAKELEGLNLVLDQVDSVGSGYYSGSDIRVQVNYYKNENGRITGSPTTGGTFTPGTSLQDLIGAIRGTFRAIAFSVTIVGKDASLIPGGVRIVWFEPIVTTGDLSTADKL